MKTATAKPNCCGQAAEAVPEGLPKLVLVDSPNVGKNLFFNRLIGTYVSVSNYPGTTVEVSRGKPGGTNGNPGHVTEFHLVRL